MKIYVLNAANMPTDALFIKRKITEAEFIHLIQHNRADLISCIGYDSVCKHILDLTSVNLTKSRDITVLKEETGYILVVKLAYRISPEKKGNYIPQKNEYEYHLVFFNKNFLIET